MRVTDTKASLQAYIDNNADSILFPLLADYHLQDNKPEEAIEICREGLEKYPNSALGHYILALAAIKINNIGMGVEHLKTAVQLDKGFLQAYYRLVEIGKGALNSEDLKKCYEKIFQLNPFDSHTNEQVETIISTAQSAEVKEVEKPGEPEVKHEVFTEPERENKEKIAKVEVKEEAKTTNPIEEVEEFAEPEIGVTAPEQLREEEAHLGPVEPETFEEEGKPAEISSEKVTVSVEEDVSVEKETIPGTVPPPPQATASKLKLDDMFSKLKSKPLDEVQKETWDISGFEENKEVAVPKAEESPVASKDEVTPQKEKFVEKTVSKEEIKPIKSIEDKVAALIQKPVEKPPENKEKPIVTSPKRKVPKKKSAEKTVENEKVDGEERVELKIPIPTLTLVEVLKKQKLYDQALDVLNILEKKSKNVEKVKKVRAEIVQLKAAENNS